VLVTPSETAPNADNIFRGGVEVVGIPLRVVDVEYAATVNLGLLVRCESGLLRAGGKRSVHGGVSHAVVEGVLDGGVESVLACQELELNTIKLDLVLVVILGSASGFKYDIFALKALSST